MIKHIENLFSQFPPLTYMLSHGEWLRVPFLSCIKDRWKLRFPKKKRRRTATVSSTTTGDIYYV